MIIMNVRKGFYYEAEEKVDNIEVDNIEEKDDNIEVGRLRAAVPARTHHSGEPLAHCNPLCIEIHCVLKSTAIHCIEIHCVLKSTATHCIEIHCVLKSTAIHCNPLQSTALKSTAIHCTAIHCIEIHYLGSSLNFLHGQCKKLQVLRMVLCKLIFILVHLCTVQSSVSEFRLVHLG